MGWFIPPIRAACALSVVIRRKQCSCGKEQRPLGDGVVRVSRETKGRKGKGVTLISGIPLAEKELKAYTKELKAKCGTGGTLKDGIVEIQGDQRHILVPLLMQKGWVVKTFRRLTLLINKQPSASSN